MSLLNGHVFIISVFFCVDFFPLSFLISKGLGLWAIFFVTSTFVFSGFSYSLCSDFKIPLQVLLIFLCWYDA